ncbi:MAG: amino acid decarboxylase [Lachnospiraceae bacterium]|jgi:arginine/lysine/ornithine decarboxylase|nr:amino acid decarboxylase [Lachnospiraceae bacterium]
MDTPIYDFIEEYKASGISRFHMPGHKGKKFLGCENSDITEIEGADVLCMADGIIARSQHNASRLFCTGETLYSAEGSSLCIKAMLMAVLMESRRHSISKYEYILSSRNIHRSMADACALTGIEIEFIINSRSSNICESIITPQDIESFLITKEKKDYPIAVYITSPGYLGGIADIKGISGICEKYNLPLLVDNAHGAYLAFLEDSLHPIKLGAAMCCDSAHKTLPVLTGGAYLHISTRYKERYLEVVKRGLAIFGSTSPSYLILQSLDLCNKYLSESYNKKLAACISDVNRIKKYMQDKKIPVKDTEPLKIVIDTASAGYTGTSTSIEMRKYGIECEYADIQYVVLMVTPENNQQDFDRIKKWVCNTNILKHRKPDIEIPQVYTSVPERRFKIREAVFAPTEIIDVKDSPGRICAAETVSCPPAVPIAVCGEVIDENMAKLFEIYNIQKVCVVKQTT